EPAHQNDLELVCLADSQFSTVYEIGSFDYSLFADSTGLLPDNKRINISLFFDEQSDQEEQADYSIFRWENNYSKWIYQGGYISYTDNSVVFESSKLGYFTILRSTDKIPPHISINVEEQEFTYGGYVSGTGIISILLSDKNGIDIFDNPFQMYLNGEIVSSDSYTFSTIPGQISSIPVKYQLNLTQGDYSLLVSCTDVNGNFSEKSVQFKVNTTFDLLNVANYPNPIKSRTIETINEGRTRFTYVLTDDADNVKIKVYTVSGRLVKTFNNLPTSVGYHEYPRTTTGWDCRDERGFYLANGIYFYILEANKGGKTISKTQKMAILK
ncbi:MAG: FlgD immunoglobulin-like domain containing protein, partial [Candidatus Cloacimonetes bacterium]|nr:FlgD immunoglobulin-like domain containing protein [Candidatus Cloacimonadota bacterium]